MTMSDNTVVCGECQTENSPENDFCSNCGMPLTRSAEEGINEQEEALDEGGLMGGSTIGLGGVSSPHITGIGLGDKEGLPTD
jgi:hypothetical protein